MSALKRNLILSNKQDRGGAMALLTLERLSGASVGSLKLYNLNVPEQLYLGVTCDKEQIFLDKINPQRDSCKINFTHPLDLNHNYAAVLFKKENNSFTPLLWDSGGESVKTKLINNLSPKTSTLDLPSPKAPLNLDEMFELTNGQDLENLVEQSFETIVTDGQFQPFKHETERLKKDQNETQIFYDLVSEQVQDLFEKYPAEEKLEALIPNSKWVRVSFNDSQTPYVLGLIYDDVSLKYICYGVTGEFSENPPEELAEYSQWLPLNPENLNEGGYWVIYQDAISGDNVRIEFI